MPDLTQQAVDDQYSKDISTRLTWQATRAQQDCRVPVLQQQLPLPFPRRPGELRDSRHADASVLLHIPNKVVQGTWSSPITNRLLAEAGVSYILEDQQFNPRPESVAPQITDPVRNVIYRAAISNMRAYTPVYGSRGSVSYVTGSHAIKAGYTLTMGDYEQTSPRVGNMPITALNGVPNVVTYHGTPTLGDQPRPAQPRPLRAGSVDGRPLDGERRPPPRLLPKRLSRSERGADPVRAGGRARSRPGGGELEGSEPALRRGVRPVRQRQDGRQGEREPLRARRRHRPREHDQPDPEQQHDGAPVDRREQRSRHPGRSVESSGRTASSLASQNPNFGKPVLTFRYDPEWSHGFQNRPYNWEFSAGVQHELMPRMSVNAAYFRRIYGNFTATDSVLVGRKRLLELLRRRARLTRGCPAAAASGSAVCATSTASR